MIKERLSEFLIGFIFGSGLLLSGMSDPAKVKAFLDVLGLWDPSLLFVMGGAVIIAFFGFRQAAKRGSGRFGRVIMLSDSKSIDLPLILGSAIFGIGWGLSGFCPGPALVAVGAGDMQAVSFVIAMLGGLAAGRALQSLKTR